VRATAAHKETHLKFLLPPILPENVAFRACVWCGKRGELMACAPRIKCSCADDDGDDGDDDVVGERNCALHDASRPRASRDASRRRDTAPACTMRNYIS